MYLFILNYPLQYAKRLLTYFQSKQQCRRIVWINNWPLRSHCNPRVPLGVNRLVSKGWMKRDHKRVTEDICSFDIAFVFWVKLLLELLNISNFSLDHGLLKIKIICFWFEKMKIDWIWSKVLTVAVNIIQVFVFSTSINSWETRMKV